MTVDRNETGFGAFDNDVRANAGYRYTVNAPLSSNMANERLTDLTRDMVSLQGLSVIDVGCGDGTYTHELFRLASPAKILGADAAVEAIALASSKIAPGDEKRVSFDAVSVYDLPYAAKQFDVAVVRGLLHHLDDPFRALERIGHVAKRVFIIEPNGYNPVLKVIERTSEYHRTHGEKSYAPFMLRKWIRKLGGKIEKESYAGLVPFFCPDPMAKLLKRLEPFVEIAPGADRMSCAVYAVRYSTPN